MRYAGALSHQFVLSDLPLTLMELENRTMTSPIGIEILERYGVVFLVREQTDHSASAEWSSGPSQCHRHAAHLLVLLAEPDILDGMDGYLGASAIAFLKSQNISLN